MQSFHEYSEERGLTEGQDSSNKIKGMNDLVTALRNWGNKYDISTRHFVWDHLNSPRGKELMQKILRNPKTYFTDSEFTKLVEKK